MSQEMIHVNNTVLHCLRPFSVKMAPESKKSGRSRSEPHAALAQGHTTEPARARATAYGRN